jgi:hypothetical protein
METEKIQELAKLVGVNLDDFGIDEDDMYKLYDQMLNETNDRPKVGCAEMDPCEFLEQADPTAYRCGFSDWTDSVRDEYQELGSRYYNDKHIEEIKEAIKDEIDSL